MENVNEIMLGIGTIVDNVVNNVYGPEVSKLHLYDLFVVQSSKSANNSQSKQYVRLTIEEILNEVLEETNQTLFSAQRQIVEIVATRYAEQLSPSQQEEIPLFKGTNDQLDSLMDAVPKVKKEGGESAEELTNAIVAYAMNPDLHPEQKTKYILKRLLGFRNQSTTVQTDYWQKRCEAAEAVIESMECGITSFKNDTEDGNKHEQAYNVWIEIRRPLTTP